MHIVPMLQVASIRMSSDWYRDVVGLTPGHGGDEFEMSFAAEPFASPLLVQLHLWDAHAHGDLGTPDLPVGNGVSLWFQVATQTEFEAAWQRTVKGAATVLQAPTWNPLAHHHEFALRDVDGYVVIVNTPFDPAGGAV